MVRVEVQEDAAGIRAAAAPGGGGVGFGGGGRREPEKLPCPRCDSTDTKFCYYNNYNLQQPRYFCKACRRYWTRGGALRNVPVGGGTRKAFPAGRRKRPSSHAHGGAASGPAPAPAAVVPLSVSAPMPPPAPPLPYELSFVPALVAMDPDRRLLDLGGSFSSLLAPAPPQHGHYASFLMGGAGALPAPAAPGLPQPPVVSQALPESFWGMGWPDLSI